MDIPLYGEWYSVFEFANAGNAPFAVLGDELVSEAEFDIPDVAEVLASSEGEEQRSDWLIVVRLKDGRFASIRAGLYGMYDSQLEWDGDANVAATLDDMIRYGLTDNERSRLGFPTRE